MLICTMQTNHEIHHQPWFGPIQCFLHFRWNLISRNDSDGYLRLKLASGGENYTVDAFRMHYNYSGIDTLHMHFEYEFAFAKTVRNVLVPSTLSTK